MVRGYGRMPPGAAEEGSPTVEEESVDQVGGADGSEFTQFAVLEGVVHSPAHIRERVDPLVARRQRCLGDPARLQARKEEFGVRVPDVAELRRIDRWSRMRRI